MSAQQGQELTLCTTASPALRTLHSTEWLWNKDVLNACDLRPNIKAQYYMLL